MSSGFFGDAPAADPSGGSTDAPSNSGGSSGSSGSTGGASGGDDDDDSSYDPGRDPDPPAGGWDSDDDGVDGPAGFGGDAAAGQPGDGASPGVIDRVQSRVGDVTAGVGDAVSDVRDAGGEVADDVRTGAGRVGAAVGDAVGTPERAPVDAAAPDPASFEPDAAGPDVGPPSLGVSDRVRDRTVETAPSPGEFDADAAGPAIRDTLDERASADIDRDVTGDLTTGGLLSETADGRSGLLPGEIGGVDVSEQRLREASANIDDRLTGGFDDNPELTVAGSDAPDRFITGGADVAADVINPAGLALGAETATEVATSAPGAVADEGAGDVAATAFGVGAAAAGATIDSARENPARTAGGAVFGFAPGAVAGRGLGLAGRSVRDRVRTAGGTRVDATDVTSESVVRNIDTDGVEGERFPGADDPGLFRTDPAAAVREQADRNTPAAVDELFGDQGVGDGTTVKKALDTEPDGPERGRAGTGFTSAPDEVDGAFDYETPGSFVGPELSPNFLRVGGRDARLSPIPGLPDFGNRPTGVLARTDVENPDADTLDEFNVEMRERAGESTAVTKPAGEGNPGEIEAVIPPGAEFEPVQSGGLLSGAARRLGIGSEFYTEIGGRRVPLRPVAPDRDADGDSGSGGGGLFGGGDDDSAPLGSYVTEPEQPVDRPLPGSTPSVPGSSPFGGRSDVSSPDRGVEPQGSTPGGSGSTTPAASGAASVFGSIGGAAASDGRGGGSGDRGGGAASSPPPSAPSPFGSVTTGAPSETAPSPTASPSEPLVGLPGAPSSARRDRRDRSDRDPEPRARPFGDAERDPANTGFVNPIAGFGLFD